MKLCLSKKGIVSFKKINLIMIERDDMMFDLLRQDIKEYSHYKNKIYHILIIDIYIGLIDVAIVN